jgi:hypothetical protein
MTGKVIKTGHEEPSDEKKEATAEERETTRGAKAGPKKPDAAAATLPSSMAPGVRTRRILV